MRRRLEERVQAIYQQLKPAVVGFQSGYSDFDGIRSVPSYKNA
ncbi:hypothetical protein NHJ13734_008237 [Beauveria thailandica]